MRYKCSNGHENSAASLPERCPACGSSLLRPLSGGSPVAVSTPVSVSAATSQKTQPHAIPVSQAIAVVTPPVISMPPRSASSVEPQRSRPWLWLAGAVAVLVLIVCGAVAWYVFGRSDDRKFASVAHEYENAVGVVVLAGQKDGKPFSTPIATAWALGEKVFVSNGHVTEPVRKALANGVAVFVILNKNPDKKFRVISAITHPEYDKKLLSPEGKDPAIPVYDVGLMFVDSKVPNHFEVASESELKTIDSGYRVAYLGFPMENMAGEGINLANPVANMQSGIITSMTDYWLSKASFEKALLLSHNLGATGGSSGSPIFNSSGEVVGILSAGNVIGQVDAQTGKVTRAPSAAMINFAQRIDVLREIHEEHRK